jgi:hypothetical protein
MNAIIWGAETLWDDAERSRSWKAEYLRIEADRAFNRALWATWLHRLGALLRRRAAAGADAAGTAAEAGAAAGSASASGGTLVPIRAIVGAVGRRGGGFRPLPPIPLSAKGAWRRLWEEDLDALPAVPAFRGTDGWYLVGPPYAVLVLEVLRAKGAPEARIARMPAAGPAAASVPTAAAPPTEAAAAEAAPPAVAGGAAPYRIVDCERDYGRCEDGDRAAG